jgi:hypothetical protein
MLYIRDFFQKHILLVDAVLLIFGFLFLLWKIPYGSYMDDQAYIIESSQRLYLGDALLVDDWFPAQLVGFINLPFFVLWMKIQGSVEGIDFVLSLFVPVPLDCRDHCVLSVHEKKISEIPVFGDWLSVSLSVHIFGSDDTIL